MIFITGDCHREYKKFNTKNFPEQKGLSAKDYVIVCGDFGYWDASKEQDYWNNWFKDKNYTTLFCDGNHENFDILNNMKIETWKGGKVHKINNKLIHLMRGQVYDLDGIKLFSFGGANSHDISDGIIEITEDGNWKEKVRRRNKFGLMQRINHLEWWKEEMPSQDEFEEALFNLDKCNNKVDIVVSHCGPSSILEKKNIDNCTDYLDSILKRIKFKEWFFGHYHSDYRIENELGKFRVIYKQIIKV